MKDDVFNIAVHRFKEKFGILSFPDWCAKNIRLNINGIIAPWNTIGHEYLNEIYNLPDVPRETHQKAAQMGISTYCLLKAFYRMDRYAMKVVYYFPTDEDVRDFAQDRANPIIDNSELLSSKCSYDKADNLGLKQLGNSSLYFRGVWTKRKVKSVDADMVVKDEVDEANQENLIFADDRLLHSRFKFIMELSQPSRPDYGINKSFKQSDQRYFMVKCKGCGKWNNIVENFPKNLMHKGKGDSLTAWLGCSRCRRKLDRCDGIWVPAVPSRSKYHIGYLESQLFSNTVTMEHIYKKFTGATLSSEKKNFSISIIGKPYRDSELCPITDSIITAAEGKHGFEKSAFSSYMGIDVGDVCHVTIWGWNGNRLRLIYCEEVLADNESRFQYLIERYSSYFVIDAMPYKSLAKRLCLRYRGWGAMQYFKGQALTEKTEGEGEYEVPVVMHDRTESIDEMASMLGEGFFEFPNPKVLAPGDIEAYEKFKEQIKNLEKEKILDKNGYEVAVYKKNLPNHYGMSMNSAFIAFRIGKGTFIPSVDPVFGS
jgi:hypothetical protein